ncbi:hypothetical protein Tco_1452432, partial [Tanacetum coccineum]
MTAHIIVVNNLWDSVSPPPLTAKPKKGKSQTVTPTLPKLQGPEASGALSKKRQKPKSKKPPTETKVTPPKPTEGSEQSHLVSSGTVPDPQDLERNIQLASMGLPSILDEGTRTTKTTPHPEGSLGDKDSGRNIPPTDMEPINLTVADPSAFLLSEDKLDKESDEEEVLVVGGDMDEDTQVAEEVRTPSPKKDQPEPSHVQESASDSSKSAVSYANLKASINEYYEENIDHRDQTDKLVEASISSLDKINTSISDLYKGLNFITKLLKDINNVVKDDPATNKKIDEAIETFAKISTNTTEVLSLVKGFDFSTLQSTMKDLQAHALKQEEESAAWTKSFTNMAWNLVPPTQAQPITIIITHPESSQEAPKIYKGKGIATESKEDPSKKLVLASTIAGLDPDEEVKVPYMINGKMYYLADKEMQAYLDKEEKLRKAVEEARLLAISKPKVIKVVQE